MIARIKQIRKLAKKNQSEFAKDLNVSPSTIKAIESGFRTATNRIISDICRVYGISEEWLRTGEGDMKAPETRSERLGRIMRQIYDEDDGYREALIEGIASLPHEELMLVCKYIMDTAERLKARREDELPEEMDRYSDSQK